MYDILYTESALKQLKKFDKAVQERIVAALERVRIRPDAFVAKLGGGYGYRLRVGDYRVIMDIDHSRLLITVTKIGNRQNIYE